MELHFRFLNIQKSNTFTNRGKSHKIGGFFETRIITC